MEPTWGPCWPPGATADRIGSSVPAAQVGAEKLQLTILDLVGALAEPQMFMGSPCSFKGHQFDPFRMSHPAFQGVQEGNLSIKLDPLVQP